MGAALYRLGRACARHHRVVVAAWLVLIDATIIRSVLVPAAMVRLGSANWWFPGWLDRILPRIGVEGGQFIEGGEAQAPAGGTGRGG